MSYVNTSQSTAPAPKGKRSVRQNIYGNWVGYVSGKRWEDFGDAPWAEATAQAWKEAAL